MPQTPTIDTPTAPPATPPTTPPEVAAVAPPGHGQPTPQPTSPDEINLPHPIENPVPVHEIPGLPPTTA